MLNVCCKDRVSKNSRPIREKYRKISHSHHILLNRTKELSTKCSDTSA